MNTLNQFKFADSFFKFYASQVRKAMEDQKQKHNDTNMAENFKTEFSATERKKKEMYDKYEKKLTQTNHIIPVYVVKQELARSTLDTDQIMTASRLQDLLPKWKDPELEPLKGESPSPSPSSRVESPSFNLSAASPEKEGNPMQTCEA